MHQTDPLTYFRLKPIQVARVSEISEITAAASIPKDERVNFHIGNPLQDERLSSAFLRIALGIDVHREELRDADPKAILDHLGWEHSELPKLEFLIQTIQKSAPYLPRGGYSRADPHDLIRDFCAWLENQQEPLHYSAGEQSGSREIILSSGGIHETLRMILVALASYLEKTPARILCYRYQLLPALKAFPNLIFEDLADEERSARAQIEQYMGLQPELPTFLIIGDLLEEETRRSLRSMSILRPLYFIEANNAPNHLSLAREAKLIQRVIRLLTPAIFAPRLQALSTVFIAGNAEYLKVIENVHFNLKGTPSASEVELLIYLLHYKLPDLQGEPPPAVPQVKPSFEGKPLGLSAETVLPQLAQRMESTLERILNDYAHGLTRHLEVLEEKTNKLNWFSRPTLKEGFFDAFSSIEVKELLDLLVENLHQPAWVQALQNSFLNAFIMHQPQYRPEACRVVSGSSRTALGILGFHCGITEVIIPDLSWSYEQCFVKTHAVPLTAMLELDVEAMIDKVEELCSHDATWPERGAVVINNPHNATGRIFNAEAIQKLILYCLQRNIYLIDDLAYQNVAPIDGLPEIKTARQVASELVWLGMLDEMQPNRLITVHSMSKTDCLAGGRLAVLEIRDENIRERFDALNMLIRPNLAIILTCYLFYRSSTQAARSYWHLRNAIFHERTQALLAAANHLPAERNPFGLSIIEPTGSMYPLLQIQHLPSGLSLDWLASSLARRGIGLLPLAAFARTEKGYETGRTTFRLTLGGVDHADLLLAKTRRLLIDLNRLIAEEETHYNRKRITFRNTMGATTHASEFQHTWEAITKKILHSCENSRVIRREIPTSPLDIRSLQRNFLQNYVPERLEVIHTRLLDRALISDELMQKALVDGDDWLTSRLEWEFMKDSLPRRHELFRLRAYDRTVHPTQMYSLQAELALDTIVNALISRQQIGPLAFEQAALNLWKEFLGRNVTIDSQSEADEILLDLVTLVAGEEYSELHTPATMTPFLSFWSDWDGSNRPSGQGHRLVAAVVMENVRRMGRILNLIQQADSSVTINPELLTELEKLQQRNLRFTRLLNAITLLTHQLEQRYRGILPFSLDNTPLQRLATRWHLRRDPARILWQHNDRYERRMLELRQQRRTMLEYYFALNKKLRKQLHALIPAIQNNRGSEPLMREVVGYRDILKRVVITPRIHQGLITARDPFAINTTVYNMYEINAVAGKYGNPGMTLAIQISLSSKPEALISLDRKMRIQNEQSRREHSLAETPSIWIVPLFEEKGAVENVCVYLDRVWDYATQSRQTNQIPQERFAEIMEEVFIAGSDLSQQVSQATAAHLYLNAKYEVQTWLAERHLAELVRIKLGSGEPMQRQGGYYSKIAGLPPFIGSEENKRRFSVHLAEAARKSTAYAVTPLQGVFMAKDLRTFQGNLSEQLRFLPVRDFVSLLHHVGESQREHRNDLIRAAESIAESRLGAQRRSIHELERLTIGSSEAPYVEFLRELTENFRHILYGREEDVVGIHIISYFIARSIPQLRDRPTSRRKSATGSERGQQILASIAEIIPLAKQGSLLRAIAHNQSQTAVLGVPQLTTGLFRALERFAQKASGETERERVLMEHLLPHLPVYEILSTLRNYQDQKSEFLNRIEAALPAGNSAFVAFREDSDAMQRFLPYFQQELLRRHGLNVNDFFTKGYFIPELLPTLRPDLAVLLQKNLFNTQPDIMLEQVSGRIADDWLEEVIRYLQLPEQIHYWRSIIWQVIGDSIFQQVRSFTELATALHTFSAARSFETTPVNPRGAKLSSTLAGFFRTARADDEMRSFLLSSIEYLSSFTEGNIEIPVSIIRAMNDVERIAQIEESAPKPEVQDVIRCCLLQIARLAGEQG
jgi:aspartate/methionine/tyrosine aminotransferase